MLDGTQSGCINHPAVEAVARCKQCGRPVCNACVVSGPNGRFCSESCQSKFMAFSERAQQLEGRSRSSFSARLRKVIASVVLLAAILAVVGVMATLFPVPVLSDLVFRVRGMLGV